MGEHRQRDESLFLIVHMLRTNKIPFIQSLPSPALALTTLTVIGVAAYLPFSSFASDIGLSPLPGIYFIW
jgi:Mg2+-importing ATPase